MADLREGVGEIRNLCDTLLTVSQLSAEDSCMTGWLKGATPAPVKDMMRVCTLVSEHSVPSNSLSRKQSSLSKVLGDKSRNCQSSCSTSCLGSPPFKNTTNTFIYTLCHLQIVLKRTDEDQSQFLKPYVYVATGKLRYPEEEPSATQWLAWGSSEYYITVHCHIFKINITN